MKNTFAVKKKSYFFSFCLLHISSISFFLFLYELTQNNIKHTQKKITTNQKIEKNLSWAKNFIIVTPAIIRVIQELRYDIKVLSLAIIFLQTANLSLKVNS